MTPVPRASAAKLDTRDRLLDAAEELFADRGVYAPSLREITKAAGQKNNSALQYHFETREVLIREIMARHGTTLAARRAVAMERLVADNALYDVRRVSAVLVRPYTELLAGTRSQLAYLVIAAELYRDPTRPFVDLPSLYDDPLLLRITEMISGLLTMPLELAEERLILGVGNVMNAAAGRAQSERRNRDRGQRLGLDAFVANQIDMFVGAVTARVSEETLTALG